MIDCQHPRSRKAKRCRACQLAALNSDPAVKERRLARIREHYADPAVRFAARERVRALTARCMADPRIVESKREHGRRQWREHLSRPDVIAKNLSPEIRKRAGAKRTATVLRDIPSSLRAEYLQLVRSRKATAAEAKAIILDKFKRRFGAG